MEYQRKALSWMMTREGALGESNVSRNILTLHPCWQQLLTADGQVLYMQREDGACSQNFYTAPHQGTCGGLLCDEMVRRAFFTCVSSVVSCQVLAALVDFASLPLLSQE